MSSDIGYVPEDGGPYLRFLLEYRKIVEAGGSLGHTHDAIQLLVQSSEHSWVQKHHEFLAGDWLIGAVQDLWGVNRPVAVSMVAAGLFEVAAVASAASQELKDLPGVGPKVLARILQRRAELSKAAL
jgi:DNA uptake protein ComE-like DNA-binding protein